MKYLPVPALAAHPLTRDKEDAAFARAAASEQQWTRAESGCAREADPFEGLATLAAGTRIRSQRL